MKKQTKTFDEILRIEAHNNVVDKERRALEEKQSIKINNFESEKLDKKREIEKRYNEKIALCNDEISKINYKFGKKCLSRMELEKKIKLRIIVDYLLTDASCSYGHRKMKKEDVVREIDGNMFSVFILIEENDNKVNKYTLRYFVGFKFYYLSDYFKDILIGCYNLCHKTFKTKEDALEYIEKNTAKVMKPLYERENDLFKSIRGFEYDVLEEFDFRGVHSNNANYNCTEITKDSMCVYIHRLKNLVGHGESHCDINVKISYLGNGVFEMNNDDPRVIELVTYIIEWGKICRIPKSLIILKSIVLA